MGQIDGKVALVTGGANGIGAAIARTFAREGGSIVLTDLDDARGEALAAELVQTGARALYLQQDVTDERRWPQVIDAVAERFGRLDALVANAGIAIRGPIVDMTLADWRHQQAVNLDGVFLAFKHAVPLMRRSGGGSIVMMSSVAGLRGAPGLAGYCATKGGVRLFAKAAAMECATAGDHIRVNSVHPGIIATDIWSRMVNGGGNERRNAPLDPHELAAVATPLGFAGAAEDIANGVLFLVSDASRYMTGSELVIDGGMTGGGAGRRS